MAKITFFEKTGCVNNTKQKKLLSLAGHTIEPIDLVKYNWTREELKSFFSGMKVRNWFNPSAPAIKSGAVNPELLDQDSALNAMLNDHLLIRRPLMIIGNKKLVGFDQDKIDELVGNEEKKNPLVMMLMTENLVDCPKSASGSSCD